MHVKESCVYGVGSWQSPELDGLLDCCVMVGYMYSSRVNHGFVIRSCPALSSCILYIPYCKWTALGEPEQGRTR